MPVNYQNEIIDNKSMYIFYLQTLFNVFLRCEELKKS